MTKVASRKGHMTLPVETGQEDVVLDLYPTLAGGCTA